MSDEPHVTGRATSAPNAMARIRARKAELAEKIATGEITPAEGSRLLREFQSLTIAHVREHGPEGA